MLWPAAIPEIPRSQCPTTREGRRQQAAASRARRMERTRRRQAEREAQRKAIDDSHDWVCCGCIQRCAKCQVRRSASGHMASCPGLPLGLAQWAEEARAHRHALATGALSNRNAPEDTVPVLVCTSCGAWATAASQTTRSLLLRPCHKEPSRAGEDVLSRVRRGLHPKAGHQPPLLTLWRPCE